MAVNKGTICLQTAHVSCWLYSLLSYPLLSYTGTIEQRLSTLPYCGNGWKENYGHISLKRNDVIVTGQLFGSIMIYSPLYLHTGGRRRIKTVLPERVDVLPQGATCLRVPGGVALFQPPPGHLRDTRRWLARHQDLRPVHEQLVRHFSFPLSSAAKQIYVWHADAAPQN